VRLSRLSPLACLALALAVLPARADAARPLPQPPMRLPSAASAATSGTETWIVGARAGSAAIAARFGARLMSDHGAYLVSRDRARAFAAALRARDLLVYAEPNGRLRRKTARDPLSDTAGWRDYIVDPAQQEPGIGPLSPQLALIDTPVEFNHGEFTNSNVTSTDTEAPVFDEHGTATAAVAAAPVNGIGIVGVWPGMRTLNIASPETFTCADSAKAIDRAIQLKVATINMSYGSPNLCFAEYVELQFAISRGIVVVAAAGNEFNAGNPLEFPASLPHVLTVAAVGADLRPAFFSNANAAVDLSAPGLGILTAVPARFDDDGPVDGYARLSGTSFSAPMVAAAATWVHAARPTLTWDQVAQVVRLSANDIGARGWDSATGFGLLDVDAALREAAPPPDPFEANDDIVWVNGKVFGEPDPDRLQRVPRPVRGSRGRLSRAAARALAHPHRGRPALRRSGPGRVQPQGAVDERALQAHRALAPERHQDGARDGDQQVAQRADVLRTGDRRPVRVRPRRRLQGRIPAAQVPAPVGPAPAEQAPRPRDGRRDRDQPVLRARRAGRPCSAHRGARLLPLPAANAAARERGEVGGLSPLRGLAIDQPGMALVQRELALCERADVRREAARVAAVADARSGHGQERLPVGEQPQPQVPVLREAQRRLETAGPVERVRAHDAARRGDRVLLVEARRKLSRTVRTRRQLFPALARRQVVDAHDRRGPEGQGSAGLGAQGVDLGG
jgi:Subtilase family